MLERSFVLLDGVGVKREQRLWQSGITDWDAFLATDEIEGMSEEKKALHDERIGICKDMLDQGDHVGIVGFFPKGELWRMYPTLKPKCFLDIETTGLSPGHSYITCIGMHDEKGTKVLVRGQDLSKKMFLEKMERYELLVTFNGMRFDVPFIEHELKTKLDEVPHVDLMYMLRRVGLKGGLKRIERELGISREEDITGVDGLEAVRLWYKWERLGDIQALDKLCRYNAADVENLRTLGEIAYSMLRDRTLSCMDE